MRSSLRLVLTPVLVLLAVWAGWYILTTPGLKPVVVSIYEPPIIAAENRIEDVGQVRTDSKAVRHFILYNKGGKHLRIAEVETSCGCTVAEISKKVIAPGDFSRLDVTLDTSVKLGKVRKKLTVVSNDPKRPRLDLFLTGEVLAAKMAGHGPISVKAKDPLVLFKGDCATCHVSKGKGKTGEALFQADCAMCHGLSAQGTRTAGPSLLTANYEDPAARARLRDVIANGSPRSPQMPPFSAKKGGPLNEDEIDSLIGFLKYQALQNKMGLLGKDISAEQDEAAFQEALQQPH